MILIKSNENSHFEIISGNQLPDKNIIQIATTPLYTNSAGYAVFIAEVADSKHDKDFIPEYILSKKENDNE